MLRASCEPTLTMLPFRSIAILYKLKLGEIVTTIPTIGEWYRRGQRSCGVGCEDMVWMEMREEAEAGKSCQMLERRERGGTNDETPCVEG